MLALLYSISAAALLFPADVSPMSGLPHAGDTNPFELVLDQSNKQGFLGVATSDSPDAAAPGAVVSRVLGGSPAAEGGLAVGDTITAVNGHVIRSSADLMKSVADFKPKQTVSVAFQREGAKKQATIVLADRSDLKWRLVSRDPPRVVGGSISLAGGIIGGALHNAGNLLLGDRAVTTVHGEMTNRWSGLAEFGISGKEAHAVVAVNGPVLLDGILSVRLSGYEPSAGDTFEIIRDAKSLSGRFDKTILPKLKPGLHWRVEYDDLEKKRDLDGDGKYDVTLVVGGKERK